MREMKIRRDPFKPAGAWLAEKLGRLKFNGQLRGYSPLSRLVELELLCIGVAGKERMWNALEHTLGGGLEKFDFSQLAERAARQQTRMRELHLDATALAFPSLGRS